MNGAIPLSLRLTNCEVDPDLSRDVDLLRSKLDIPSSTNEVVVHPMVDSYEPEISRTGCVWLGSPGVEDFQARFGFIVGIDPTRLLVAYSVAKHGIRDRYGRSLTFSNRVDEVASIVEPLVPERIRRNRAVVATNMVIGRLSVICAVSQVACGFSGPDPNLLPGRIMSGAESKTRIDSRNRKAQTEAMGHLSLSVGGGEDTVIRKLLAPA